MSSSMDDGFQQPRRRKHLQSQQLARSSSLPSTKPTVRSSSLVHNNANTFTPLDQNQHLHRPSPSTNTTSNIIITNGSISNTTSSNNGGKKKKKRKGGHKGILSPSPPSSSPSLEPSIIPAPSSSSTTTAAKAASATVKDEEQKHQLPSSTTTITSKEQQKEQQQQDNTNTADKNHQHGVSFSFWDYLRDELTVSDFDTQQEIKRERITNFLGVPAAIEKLMAFGFVVCLDSFLYTFTILPLRFGLAFYHYMLNMYHNILVLLYKKDDDSLKWLRPSQKCDLLKGFISLITCVMMSTLDPSRIYHSIRGQAVLKLYVVFSVLEVFDKLCCSVGGDILDALFSKSTLGNSEHGKTGGASYAKRQLKPVTLFFLATGYMVIHTAVLFFEMITLNVAINFYSNALLSLLISNQFVEIKQSVFKKFERENLFQLSCSDMVERFQQVVFLIIITLRNVIELSDSSPSSILPSTFVPLIKLPATTTLNALMTPVVMVIASELIVDWLKHAFITKFNQIRPSIYGKYVDVLCKDLVVGSPGRLNGRTRNAFIDQSPVVSRRIGFPALPLACLHIRMIQQLLPMMFGAGDQNNASSASSFIIQGVFGPLADHQSVIGSLLPTRIQLIIASLIRYGWLEKGLDRVLRVVGQFLIIAILAVCLLALKVFVGTNLLGYAYRRYASMTERDTRESEKDKEMKEMNKDEELYNKKLREYLSDPADSVMGRGPVKYTLENVDRFSMVRSRIP
ncbi:eukaryotic membrane protein family-domain-containing protein [Zychaea mexicana]|uniref:eukaryotic membrane protein family-domain-containing protein n=1 Tax=Zychaea mexicana TaxID=64656 RepID=UPI0022FDE672|nr:eukaryotic membrane protein family-domain-containing protein [Zychaea mexicana]KAI9497393.1 eukaryotic membrane protein family-domain-containing protein [Zychaea mexicana]